MMNKKIKTSAVLCGLILAACLVEPEPPVLTSVLTGITLNTGDVKTTYTVGDAFTSAELVVTARYDDNTTEPVTDYTLTWDNAPLAEGNTTITVNGPQGTPFLTGITLNTSTVKTTYALDEPFTSDGLAVEARYSDNTGYAVTDYTLSWNSAVLAEGSMEIAAAAGEKTVTVTYQDKTATFVINVGGMVTPALKIDGVVITIPVPTEGVDTLNVSAVVSNGVVADFSDTSGILAGKTINLTLSAAASNPAVANDATKKQLNYSAIVAIENAFKNMGAAAVSSDADIAGGTIPVFNVARANNDIEALALRADVQNPDVKIVSGIHALYNNGNQILQVSSPMQLAGSINCSELARIQTNAGNIYADDTLRISENNREIELADLLNAYARCGFVLNGNNNFFPKPGNIHAETSQNLSLDITDTASSWDIYRLFERYHAAGKLNNLTQLHAQNITVAGEDANGLYGLDNQPDANFPYKVNGEIIAFMSGFKGFENMYENQGNLSLGGGSLHVKNFATKSNLPNTQFYADGACFFEYAPPYVNSTGAVKFMNVGSGTQTIAAYLDLRNLTRDQTRLVNNDTLNINGGNEIAFSSPNAVTKTYDDRNFLQYDIGYANDNSGITKLIGLTSDGFGTYQASTRNTGIYGVLDLQGWTDGAPPATKTSASFSAGEKWTAADFNAALIQ
ncbi:MAG: bacterial Ig-like domain-containing protein [Treponema sp.]|jgi:hypothetical protein|nr:bacterial Ig-like domain-containing protein [Treponema sp.]